MFGKLVPVPSGAVIPERDIGKRRSECAGVGKGEVREPYDLHVFTSESPKKSGSAQRSAYAA